MAERPVFISFDKEPFYRIAHVNFEWHSGLSVSQKQKNVKELHEEFGELLAEDKTDHYNDATLVVSVKSFLSSAAVLANENYFIDDTGIYCIDYDSSFCCTPGNVHHIHVPTLVMGLNSGYEFMAAEEVYRNCVSEDKTLAFVNGVNHPIMNMFDYIAEWIDARY